MSKGDLRIEIVLRDLGCEVVCVQRKDQAMERLPEIRPALVTTDLTPDTINGLDVIQAVRKFDPSIPVIVISGNLTVENARQARQLGAYDCFPKPFDALVLPAGHL